MELLNGRPYQKVEVTRLWDCRYNWGYYVRPEKGLVKPLPGSFKQVEDAHCGSMTSPESAAQKLYDGICCILFEVVDGTPMNLKLCPAILVWHLSRRS